MNTSFWKYRRVELMESEPDGKSGALSREFSAGAGPSCFYQSERLAPGFAACVRALRWEQHSSTERLRLSQLSKRAGFVGPHLCTEFLVILAFRSPQYVRRTPLEQATIGFRDQPSHTRRNRFDAWVCPYLYTSRRFQRHYSGSSPQDVSGELNSQSRKVATNPRCPSVQTAFSREPKFYMPPTGVTAFSLEAPATDEIPLQRPGGGPALRR